MEKEIQAYHLKQIPEEMAICNLLYEIICDQLPKAERKIWHAHPVWFLDGNPIVGYSKLKGCIRLLFWSGQSFKTSGLKLEGKFKAAEARYTTVDEIETKRLIKWLKESEKIQWDYKNLIKRRGELLRLNP